MLRKDLYQSFLPRDKVFLSKSRLFHYISANTFPGGKTPSFGRHNYMKEIDGTTDAAFRYRMKAWKYLNDNNNQEDGKRIQLECERAFPNAEEAVKAGMIKYPKV